MPNIDDFRTELRQQFERAQAQGRAHIEVNAGELHRTLGGYPGADHRMPTCCSALKEEFARGNAVVIWEPPSTDGASLTMLYGLPRASNSN
jgi:hypothetical protein